MIRHWGKLILLALVVLIQTACPKYVTRQSENSTAPTEDHNGDHNGSG